MSTYERAPKAVEELAHEILCAYAPHKPLLDARVKIDFVFAYGDADTGAPAIKHHGVRALGLCRRIGLKDRAMGRGDAEIILDADWWAEATADQARALLDHELTHLEVMTDKHGRWEWDDLHRPKLRLRPHDYEFGWFVEMARRHGAAAQERIQAKTLLDASGQWLWPDLVPPEPPVEAASAAGKGAAKKTYHLKKP